MSGTYTYCVLRYPEDCSETAITQLISLNQYAYHKYLVLNNLTPWGREDFIRQLRLYKTIVVAKDQVGTIVGFSLYRDCGLFHEMNYLKLGPLGNCHLDDKLTIMLPNMYRFLVQPTTMLWASVPNEPTAVENFLRNNRFVTCTDLSLARELLERAHIPTQKLWAEETCVFFRTRLIRKILIGIF